MLESLDIVGAFSYLILENYIFVTYLIIGLSKTAKLTLRTICMSKFC